MADLTLGEDLSKGGTCDLVTPWVADSLKESVQANIQGTKVLADGKAECNGDENEESEQREISDPFARILQKVGAPLTLLKNNKHVGKAPTLQELMDGQAKRKYATAEPPHLPETPLGKLSSSNTSAVTAKTTAVKATERGRADLKSQNSGDKEGRETSADTAASPLEIETGRSSSSLLHEGVSAIGDGVLVDQDEFTFTERDMYSIASACQSAGDMAAAALKTVNGARVHSPASAKDTITSSTPDLSNPISSLGSPLGAFQDALKRQGGNGAGLLSAEENRSPKGGPQWPFESELRPWDDVEQEKRQIAEGVSGHQLEDHNKKCIWVVHRGVCTPVSWYSDTSAEDVKTSILCACDVLADEGEHLEEQEQAGAVFCLRQIKPLPESADVDTDDLFMGIKTLTLRCNLPAAEEAKSPPQHQENAEVEAGALGEADKDDKEKAGDDGATYLLENYSSTDADPQQSEELANLRKLTGDKWRRLAVAVDPLLHIEAQKAIQNLRRGTNLLKHTRFGHPHLRQFQLSADRQRLVWYSASKGKETSVVQMSDLQGVVLGQKSATFNGYRIPALQHLSFSLVFKEEFYGGNYSSDVELPETSLEDARTLDLTCKDEFEFDTWVTGCKSIIAANKGLRLSKMQLLCHSRRFMRAVGRSDATVQLTKLPEITERAGLQDCMDLPWHPPEELEKKYEEQKRRADAVAEQMRGLDRKAVVRSNVDLSVLVGAGPAYATILGDSEAVDDEEMEFERMRELLQEVIGVLKKAKAELTEYREAESKRPRKPEVESVESVEGESINPRSREEPMAPATVVSAGSVTEAFTDATYAPESSRALEGLDTSKILAISSQGQVLMKTGAPGLTFDERFKMVSSNSVDLDAVQEQVKEGLTTLLQHAAEHTAEAQQLLSSALAAAAAVVGVESELQRTPEDTLPPQDVEKLKSINQLLWRAEVDVENIEDMLARLQSPSGFGGLALAGTVANLNQMVTDQVNKWGGQLTNMVTDLLRRAEVPQLMQTTGQQNPPYTESDYEDNFN